MPPQTTRESACPPKRLAVWGGKGGWGAGFEGAEEKKSFGRAQRAQKVRGGAGTRGEAWGLVWRAKKEVWGLKRHHISL